MGLLGIIQDPPPSFLPEPFVLSRADKRFFIRSVRSSARAARFRVASRTPSFRRTPRQARLVARMQRRGKIRRPGPGV